MTSTSIYQDQYILVGEKSPGWLIFLLVGLGSFSILLAFWLLMSPKIFSVSKPVISASQRERVNSVSPQSLAAASVARETVSGAADKAFFSIPERLPDISGMGSEGPTSTMPAGLPRPESLRAEQEPVSSSTKGLSHSGSVQGRRCPTAFTITFGRNSTTPLIVNKQEEIAYLRRWLDSHPQARVVLEGHSDTLGSEEYNLLLSYRRVQGVAATLAKAGFPSERLLGRALGEQFPLRGVDSMSAENRRVAVLIEGADACPRFR